MPGEIAEMMLDGTLCEGCGEWMGGEGFGGPRYCSASCARDRGALEAHEAYRGNAHGRPRGPGYTPPDPNSNRSKKKAARRFIHQGKL